MLSTVINVAAAAATTNAAFDPSSLLFPVLMVFVIFMMWNSGRKRKRAAEELQNSLAIGTDVVLHSGITGKIVSIDETAAVIETTPKVKIRVLLGAIRNVDSTNVIAPAASDEASENN